MSTHIVGIREPDAEWERMKAVVDACRVAKIDVPDNVWKFFNYQEPDEDGIVVDLEELAEEWSDGCSSGGYQINISDLPDNITSIRFFNSW